MPALKILGNLTTKPFAGDDLHLLCTIQVFFRLLQFLVCILPLTITILLENMRGENRILVVNGTEVLPWCPEYHEVKDKNGNWLTLSNDLEPGVEDHWRTWLLLVYCFIFMDLVWAAGVWKAASTIGTPTESEDRDRYLRPLFLMKLFFINLFPAVLLGFGIWLVQELRGNNYRCGDEEPLYYIDDQVWFAFFSFLMFTYAIEVCIWPAIIVHKLARLVRKGKYFNLHESYHRLEMWLLGCFRFISCLKCGNFGGKDIKKIDDLRDFSVAILQFGNSDTKMGIMLSDLYVGFKLLARAQAESKNEAVHRIASASVAMSKVPQSIADGTEKFNDEDKEQDQITIPGRRTVFAREANNRRHSIMDLQVSPETGKYILVERKILAEGNETDEATLAQSARHVIHAQTIYGKIPDEIFEWNDGLVSFSRPTESLNNDEYYLTGIAQQEKTKLCYYNGFNGISKTPYAILVDEEVNAVVVVVRGTKSLEDIVIDLQSVPQELSEVGKRTGFDGEGHYCHKGVLTRCKWMYNDIKKNQVLKHLYADSSKYKDFELVITGHSLGGACACMLSLLLRSSFPSLKCFAYEPPPIFDEALSEICEEWITTIVTQDDIVPRLSFSAAEELRAEYFDILLRCKVPKTRLIEDIRTPCPKSALKSRNAKVLMPRDSINQHTEFWLKYQQYKKERSDRAAEKCFLAGKIIHLVDMKGDGSQYIPVWASRHEFKSIVLSDRMISDHRVPPIMKILSDIKLDQIGELSIEELFHIEAEEINGKENDSKNKEGLCSCFSSSQGRYAFLLALITTVALVLSFFTDASCNFFTRGAILNINGTLVEEPEFLRVGLNSFEMKRCADGGNQCFEDINPDGLDLTTEAAGCTPFPPMFEPDAHWEAARAASFLALIFGVVCCAVVWSLTCLSFGRRSWYGLAIAALMAAVSQSLLFLVLGTEFCTGDLIISDMDAQIIDNTADSNPFGDMLSTNTASYNCYMSTYGKVSIFVVCLWVTVALASFVMGRRASGVKTNLNLFGLSAIWEDIFM